MLVMSRGVEIEKEKEEEQQEQEQEEEDGIYRGEMILYSKQSSPL